MAVLALTACRSYGPQFDARDRTGGIESFSPRYVTPAELDESLFASINSTNEIQPEWLEPPKKFFTLGPGDVVEIEILGEFGSTSTALVGPDGKIYYSLLPGLFVWGLTMSEARERLEGSIRDEQFMLAQSLSARSVYRVQRDDTLARISLTVYGTANRWPEIFEANRHLLENPDRVFPGMSAQNALQINRCYLVGILHLENDGQ